MLYEWKIDLNLNEMIITTTTTNDRQTTNATVFKTNFYRDSLFAKLNQTFFVYSQTTR